MLATDVRDHSEQALIAAKTSWHVRFRNIKKQLQACESESVLARLTLAWSTDWIDRIRGVDRVQTQPGARRASEGAFNVSQ